MSSSRLYKPTPDKTSEERAKKILQQYKLDDIIFTTLQKHLDAFKEKLTASGDFTAEQITDS
jgi:hypothetical protein